MKKLSLFLSMIVMLAACQFTSCSKSNSPVDQIVALIDKNTKEIKKMDLNDISDLQNMFTPEVDEIIKENSDYELTDSDKNKLKKSMKGFADATYDKVTENLPIKALKEEMKSQLEIVLAAVDYKIESAKTLGDIYSL